MNTWVKEKRSVGDLQEKKSVGGWSHGFTAVWWEMIMH